MPLECASRENFSSLISNIFPPFFSVPNYEIVQIHSVRHKRSPSSTSNQADIHRVNLATHGRQLRLELRPNPHLVPQSRQLDLWYADAFPTNVSYSPVEKVRNVLYFSFFFFFFFESQCCQLRQFCG